MLTHVNTDEQKREIARPRHPDQHIARAIPDAEKLGWMVVLSNGHAWERLFCSDSSRDGCIVGVWSTPRVPENHARQIRREIDLCPHCRSDGTGEAIKRQGSEMNPRAREREHDFTLVRTGITEITPAVEDSLFSAGCDDATIATRSGRLFVTFSRTARSIKDAVFSAIRDIGRGCPGVDVLRIDFCDLVTPSEIARKIGRSRQIVHQ